MKRRDFIKGSTAVAVLPFWLQGCQTLVGRNFPIHVHSDKNTGHLLMQSVKWETSHKEKTEVVIVGGGVAGIAAAHSLGHSDFQLFEASNRLGGTSAAQTFNGISFSQGAHYELAYPEYYGEEVLTLLQSLKVISHEPWKKTWSFEDRQHIIPFQRRQQCYQNGQFRGDVLEESYLKNQFYDFLKPFLGKMHLPTRLIPEEVRYLNDLNFHEFLSQHLETTDSFIKQIDYHMMDDYGGRSDQVSALAGVHYFMCRPYLEQPVDLFSAPNGNDYFVKKMTDQLSSEKLNTNHLVSKVEKNPSGYLVEVLDAYKKTKKAVSCEKVIYAGQKHALKYIYPNESNLFDSEQAPWMVVNFVCNGKAGKYGFWQNEFLGKNESFLGFIDSSVQDQKSLNGNRILTGYYCLKPEDRNYLATIEKHQDQIAAETLEMIEEMLNEHLDIQACFIHVMGHAMAIPKPGFLLNDANNKKSDLIYAGVDNGRLPLLFEALDSGILAAKMALDK